MKEPMISSTGGHSSVADMVISAVIVAQIVCLYYRVSCVHDKDLDTKDCLRTLWIVRFNKGMSLFWAAELICRLCVLSVENYVYSRHMINGVLTVVIAGL